MTTKPLITALLLVLAPSACLHCQEEDKASVKVSEEELQTVIPEGELLDSLRKERSPSDIALGRETITLDFPEEDVRTVLRVIADLYQLNLVIPEELEGSISIKLRDVGWREAFDTILDSFGYTYIIRGNLVKIISIDNQNIELLTSMGTQIQFNRVRLLIHTEILKALAEHPEKAAAKEFAALTDIPNDPSSQSIAAGLELLAFLKEMELKETAEWVAAAIGQ